MEWLHLVVKPEREKGQKKEERLDTTSCTTVLKSLASSTDPLMRLLCQMLDESAQVYEVELRNLVRRVRDALRRSPEHHRMTLEEAVEDPEKAKQILGTFIDKSPTLRKHLKLEYPSIDAQMSNRKEKYDRVMFPPDVEPAAAYHTSAIELLPEATTPTKA